MAEYVKPNAREAVARPTLHDRVLGCLFDSALGDALGFYTGFLSNDLASLPCRSRIFTVSPSLGGDAVPT
ncbi:hypothetical protein ACRE_045850 [Hapsidospora chrysogenum ATCC 11550]|uniref:Uncharacterized protein n=1 Tax=Hapsidospora chrysogenum (strain ATCC 11550 / CBS 779.69 / DSM 880 / IAM 14645 / JCM 23072 / IMI 49137) TaxID=857340 RepID=A0A086T5K5_HAPC1|nr:hypothetical protein ACRE_045850 [Hapsidospora chrysogenum ATCC 11550]